MKTCLLISFLTLSHCWAQSGLWERVAPAESCSKRHEAALVAVSGKLYLLGGRGIKPVEEYDPAANTWKQLAAPPMQIHHFQAIAVEGRIAMVGAMTGGYPKEPALPNIWWFDPQKNEWSQGVEIPEARRRGGAGAVLHEGKIYLVCGNTNGHWNGFVPWMDVLDLKTGQWSVLPDAPHARDHFQAALVDGKIIAAGGRRTYTETKQTFNLTVPEVDVFDIAIGAWSTLSENIPTPRAGCMATVRDGRIIIIGGESGGENDAHSEVEALLLSTGKWEKLPPLNEGRHGTGATFIGDTVYVAAGCAVKGGGKEIDSMERLVWPAAETANQPNFNAP